MINTGILCGSTSGPSARLIRDYIFKQSGRYFKIARDPTLIKNVIIRYGHAGRISGNDTDANCPQAILTCGNKLAFSRIMQENNIYSPVYYQNDSPDKFPVVIRKTLRGYGGAGIIMCRTAEEFKANYNPGDYWTYFVSTKTEVRLHCIENKVVRIFKKVPRENYVEPELPIRHNANYRFSLRDNRHYPNLISFIEEKVLPTLNIYFCGLDVGLVGDNKFFIFEANSAPGISEVTASIYGDYLIEHLEI